MWCSVPIFSPFFLLILFFLLTSLSSLFRPLFFHTKDSSLRPCRSHAQCEILQCRSKGLVTTEQTRLGPENSGTGSKLKKKEHTKTHKNTKKRGRSSFGPPFSALPFFQFPILRFLQTRSVPTCPVGLSVWYLSARVDNKARRKKKRRKRYRKKDEKRPKRQAEIRRLNPCGPWDKLAFIPNCPDMHKMRNVGAPLLTTD